MIAHGSSWAGPYHSNLASSQCPVNSPLTDDATSTTSHSISDATNCRGIIETRKAIAFQQSHQTVAGVGLFSPSLRRSSLIHRHWKSNPVKNSILETISPTRVIHNIEFSCPAASAHHHIELPSRIRRSKRPPRGQLQRFVMFTPVSFDAIESGLYI